MSIRPFRDIKRKKTKVVNVGNVKIGGDNPISVQSMTNTLTTEIKATIKQINDIHEEGADLVRVSCPDESSSKALKEIVKHVDVPLIADIHFHYKRAIEAAKSGANCLRINPGNIGSKEKVQEILKAAKKTYKKVVKLNNAWRDTQKIIKKAEKAHNNKKYDKSTDLAKKALNQAKMAIEQHNSQKDNYRFLDD